MLTFTGAWSKVADSGVLSKVMVTGTVGPELVPLPPDEQVEVLAELLPLCAPVPDPVPPPLGQVATLPTVSMCPPTVEVPLGSTIDHRVAGLHQVLLAHVEVDGDDGGGARGREHRAAPASGTGSPRHRHRLRRPSRPRA